MSKDHHDDNCPDCRPALLDPKTGLRLPDDSPEMKIVLAAWEASTLEERCAFHHVTVNGSRVPADLTLVWALIARMGPGRHHLEMPRVG